MGWNTEEKELHNIKKVNYRQDQDVIADTLSGGK